MHWHVSMVLVSAGLGGGRAWGRPGGVRVMLCPSGGKGSGIWYTEWCFILCRGKGLG